MKNKLSKKQAISVLELMYESGDLPNNFTKDHSEWERAIDCLIKNGYLIKEDFFSKF